MAVAAFSLEKLTIFFLYWPVKIIQILGPLALKWLLALNSLAVRKVGILMPTAKQDSSQRMHIAR